MDERTRRSSKHDDVPIIGDYSDDQNARLRPHAPDAPNRPSPPPAPRAEPTVRDDQWKLDPRDVQRHARRASQRPPGTFVKVRWYASIALAVAAGVLVYWNFDALRGIAGFTSSSRGDVAASGDDVPVLEPETAPVEGPVPAVADAPTAVEAPIPAAADPPTAVEDPPALADVPVEEEVPVPRESPPPAPPEPETLAFGRPVNTVSEGDAAAAVIVQRRGGNRGASTFAWWTSSGTAGAGVDYADLGVIVERFEAGRETRTIRIPIVGDRAVEQPETFYVHLAPGERADASNEVRTEVVITSDD